MPAVSDPIENPTASSPACILSQARAYFDKRGDWPEDEPTEPRHTWALPAGGVTFEQELVCKPAFCGWPGGDPCRRRCRVSRTRSCDRVQERPCARRSGFATASRRHRGSAVVLELVELECAFEADN
jgi:hypothetical protein